MAQSAPSASVSTRLAWETAVRETIGRPGVSDRLAHPAGQLFLRFGFVHARLVDLPRAQRRRLQRRLGVSLAGVALLLALGVAPAPALAGTIIVDGTICTLADAITTANSGSDTGGCTGGSLAADTIDLQADVRLTATLPAVTSEITLEGNSHTIERTDGDAFSVLTVANDGDLTLRQATVSGGTGSGAHNCGGGIYNSGKLKLDNSTVSGNSATYGGGIYNRYGLLTVANSTISGNSAEHGGALYNYDGTADLQFSILSSNFGTWGGGIDNTGTLIVEMNTVSGNTAENGAGIWNDGLVMVWGSTFSGNSASGRGGGVANYGTASIEYCTLTGNSASNGGGGLLNQRGTTTVQNSTLSGNTVQVLQGAGIYNHGGSTETGAVTVLNSTLSGNSASLGSSGVYLWGGTMTIQNSIVALQEAGTDCGVGGGGSIVSSGYNIESGISCGFNGTGDQRTLTNTTLKLQALADNGGPTQTMALASGSVAIDQIPDGTNDCTAGESMDQRGAVRAGDNVPAGSGVNRGGTACDVGAYEYDSNQNPNAVVLSDLFAVTGSPGGVLARLGALLAAGLGGVAFWRRRRVRADPTRQTPTRGSPSLAIDLAKAVYVSPAVNFDAPLEVRAGSPLSLPLDDLIE